MMKKLPYAICLLLLLSSFQATGQYILNEADKEYEAFKYTKAIDLYEQAYKKKPTLHAAERLADCYRFNFEYRQAESWYAIAIAMPGSKTENILYYAKALQNNSKYAAARTQYSNYAAADKKVTAAQKETWLNSCDSAIAWMAHPQFVLVENYKTINTAQSDWGAVPYMEGTVFTSDRYTQHFTKVKTDKGLLLKFDVRIDPDKKRYSWTGNDYLHLYYTTADSTYFFPLKTGTDFHVGPVTFTKNYKEAYFSLTRIPRKLNRAKGAPVTVNIEIYSSKKDTAGNWSAPHAFSYNNVNVYSVSDPFIAPDGDTLYFVSNMPGGAGGSDIYFCVKTTTGEWDKPINLKEINTAGNERSPAVDKNNTLYFSSDGRVGMGGLDIYSVARDASGKITGQVINKGYPLNSPHDDFAFNVRETDGIAYLSSDREGGVGSDDVYKVSPQITPPAKTDLAVLDGKTNEPLQNGIVTLVKEGSPDTLAKTGANKETRLENIYFDFNTSTIRPDAKVALDLLVKLMKNDTTTWIVLGSHTDSRGNDDYNLKLSQRRAAAVVAYLISKGISKNRVEAKGYGETILLNRCANGVKCTEAAHQVNRRTEFKIVKY